LTPTTVSSVASHLLLCSLLRLPLQYFLGTGQTFSVDTLGEAGSDRRREVAVDDPETHEEEADPLGRLVTEIGRAAGAGWAQTARMIALLFAVAAAAGVLVIVTSR
jgi:hypothetical protein